MDKVVMNWVMGIVVLLLVFWGLWTLKFSIKINVIFKEMNKCYKEIIWGKTVFEKVVMGVSIGLMEMLILCSAIQMALEYEYNIISTILMIICGVLIVNIVCYITFGIPILILSKIMDFVTGIKDKQMNSSYLIGFLILLLILVFRVSPTGGQEQPKMLGAIFAIGLLVAYFLNTKILIQLLKYPAVIVRDEPEDNKEEHILAALIWGTVLLTGMTIFNFSLAVWLLSDFFPEIYALKIGGLLDSIYYVVMSFTTIGYGDIAPVQNPGRVLAIVISATSVLYLIVFVNIILTYIINNYYKGCEEQKK